MAVIRAARRTAIVPRGGVFRDLRLEDLAAPVIQAVIADAGLTPDDIDEVIVANAIGPGGNPARRIALAAGLPERVAGLSIDRQCVGGLDAIALAATLVRGGARAVIAGGVESFSQRPTRAMGGVPYTQAPFTPWPDRDPDMTAAAAAMADRLGISRAAQEAWALRSHALAVAPCPEVVPVAGVNTDPFRRDLTPALLARLPAIAGTITAGTAAVEADGAAFVLVTADGPGLQIVSSATIGSTPDDPALGAIPAIRAALARAGLTPEDLTRAEVMEAYAAQALATIAACALTHVNPDGGALARGHPIGASGAVLVARLFHGLTQGAGLAAIAGAGGLGSAMVVRR
jgi:acetyl-CoA C-acetyltransferase